MRGRAKLPLRIDRAVPVEKVSAHRTGRCPYKSDRLFSQMLTCNVGIVASLPTSPKVYSNGGHSTPSLRRQKRYARCARFPATLTATLTFASTIIVAPREVEANDALPKPVGARNLHARTFTDIRLRSQVQTRRERSLQF